MRQGGKIEFTKMHGCGNDYIYINCFDREIDSPDELAIALSDRHFGIGGDGMVLICRSDIADAKMRMFNMDGSEGKMCGNAIRCVAKYLYDNGLCKKDEPLNIRGQTYNITCVSMGNPHAVVFCDDTDGLDIAVLGPCFEYSEIFPERVNTEFVQVIDRNTIKMRVWERGSGETLACGTGACAATVASVLNGHCDKGQDIRVMLRGGELIINYTDERVLMTGNCVKVFEGVIEF